MLQGVWHSNAGKPRRAWLCFRRALDIALLMGLHRISRFSTKGLNTAHSERLREIWWFIFEADRYIALILGLPYGISNKHCDLELGGQNTSLEGIYLRKLAIITAEIVDRNQAA